MISLPGFFLLVVESQYLFSKLLSSIFGYVKIGLLNFHILQGVALGS